ncbi:OB-fold domain-containing protein [Saccharomonospora sp. NPDC046836]|uniref:Zn-ribbon domain-containing OB-fold protein n=1 Tax=Saccharomonospora sp. NPDC046836 TaxID=3156921 RepID=UPI0033C61AA4
MYDIRNEASSTGADHRYRAFLAEGEFRIPRCAECGRAHFYPRVVCPFCDSTSLEWVLASGLGHVYSTTVVRGRSAAYNVALVDLEEGPRMMTRIDGLAPESVTIGMPVRARILADDEPLIVFVPEQPR